jgi:tripeptide aminopeptidase
MRKNKLLEILKIQSYSHDQFLMFAHIIRQINQIPGCKYYTYNGCIYVTKGKATPYPCVVSHMDTVHEIVEDLTPVEINGNITGINSYTMQQTGIGGDDKVGIFIALECLHKFDNIKVVFFRDEEVGCEGSYEPDMKFFKDCNFILQCDRRGNDDFITTAGSTELSSNKFQKEVKPILTRYGYKFNTGMMTDVMALKQSGIECSMANISCGYYNPHYADEFINLADVENCMNMVMDIITHLRGRQYPCTYKKPVYKPAKVDYLNYNLWDDKPVEKECSSCLEIGKLIYVKDYDIELCSNCYFEYVETYLNT